MPILPQTALFVILQSWSVVLQVVSAYWYERQLHRYQDHWLVHLTQIADLRGLEQACTGFQADNGQGKPITHTPARLVRALLVKYLYTLSLRQTEELIDNHILIKWFVGYPLFTDPLDHSYLNRFEMWLFDTCPRLFFDEVIRLIDHLCPEDRERIQLVDTFGMQARAAKTYLIDLLRTVCAKLLNLLAQTDPDFHLTLLLELDLTTLFGRPQDKITPALNRSERAARLQGVARQTLRLARLLNHHLDQAPHLPPQQQVGLRVLLAHLSKIINDETSVTANNPIDPDDVSIVERKHGDKGSYRIGSATDFDPTYRKHDDHQQAMLGYNPTVLGTKVFIREVQVDTGAQQDNLALPQVLQTQFDHHAFFPDFVAGDMKYGYGKTRAQVTQVTHHQTQIIALLPGCNQRTEFGPAHFSLSDDGLSLTCPNQRTTDRPYLTEGRGGADFRFPAKLCRDCPLWDQCRGPDSKKSTPRSVFMKLRPPNFSTRPTLPSTASKNA